MKLPALLIMTLPLAVLLAGCGGPTEAPAEAEKAEPEVAKEPTALTEVSWRTYHGDAALTGYTEAQLPDRLQLAWRYQAGDRVYAPPVTEGDRWYLVTLKGKVIALDMDGEEVWNKQIWAGEQPDGTPRTAVFDSPPAIFGDTLYLAASRGAAYALDPATGEIRWEIETEGNFQGTPTLVTMPDGNNAAAAFLSQADGTLYAYNPETGEKLWEILGPERCDGSAASRDGKIVFGSCAAALHVLSAADGAHEQDIPIAEESQVAGGVALVDGSVFSGSRSGMFLHADLATAKVLWTNNSSEDEIYTTPAVSSERVVFTSRDGMVFCLDRTSGEELWKYDATDEPASPVIARDKVVVTAGGFIYILNLADGEMLWQRKVSDEISSPAVINNMIVVGGEDGAITAFGVRETKEGE